MPFLGELPNIFGAYDEDEIDEYGLGPYTRPTFQVGEEVGRRTLQKVQPEIEGRSVGQFLGNLVGEVAEIGSGMFAMATYPIRHPIKTGEALSQPVETATSIGGAVWEGTKQHWTPQEDETVPGMILRNLYEKPITTLMDLSVVGQAAFGGAGLAAKAATAGLRGRVAAEAIAKAGGAALPEITGATRAAAAQRTINLMQAAAERAKRLDPISMAVDSGKFILETARPDLAAAVRATSKMTDAVAERTVTLRTAEDQATQKTQQAFQHLNKAERNVVWPYISGRLNLDRPIGEQLMAHTGEWVPVKGNGIRLDALEQARQAYLPIQNDLQRAIGRLPEQVFETASIKALGKAKKFLGDELFDPMHPAVQEYMQDYAAAAVAKNEKFLQRRATGEMRTSLDIAQDKKWKAELEKAINDNTYDSLIEAERGLPRPRRTTPEEAIAMMGPQGGVYFPHSAETYGRDLSTIGNILTKLGEALPYKENHFALFASGVMEIKDPVAAILRAYSVHNKGRTWLSLAQDAAEQGVAEGKAFRMPKGWKPATDPRVVAETHQPFHPGQMLRDDFMTEDAQRMLTRLLEVADDPTVRNLNIFDITENLVKNYGKGPVSKQRGDVPHYLIPKDMGHSIKALRNALEPPTSPMMQYLDNFTQWWNHTNLNLRLSRLNNNVIGNTFFAGIQGVHPFAPRGLQALVATGRAMMYKAGLAKGAEAGRLAKVFDLPGIRSGALQQNIIEMTGGAGKQLLESKYRAAQALGVIGETFSKWNLNVESAYRAASMFYELSPNAVERGRRMVKSAHSSMTLGATVAEMAKAGADVTMKNATYRTALKQVNRYFHDYSRSTPFERQIMRRVFPYYKFYKHSTDLITRFPFEHPLKARLARTMGSAALQDVKDTMKEWGLDWDKDVPPAMRDSLPMSKEIDPNTGEPVIWMYNTKGPNPFSQLSGYVAEQATQMLNPVIKVFIEQATGTNLFTRERYRGAISSYTGREYDPDTGQIVDSFNAPSVPESFLRSFWPYQTVRELVAQGRMPVDTASLIDMATSSPEAWVLDKTTGLPKRRPLPFALAPLMRIGGPVPTPLEMPTEEIKAKRKATISEQLRTLWQRYPEARDKISDAMNESAEEIIREFE